MHIMYQSVHCRNFTDAGLFRYPFSFCVAIHFLCTDFCADGCYYERHRSGCTVFDGIDTGLNAYGRLVKRSGLCDSIDSEMNGQLRLEI